MLRYLAYAYFVIALIEITLVPLGKFELVIGLLTSATSVFFGGVLFGLAMIVELLRKDGRRE